MCCSCGDGGDPRIAAQTPQACAAIPRRRRDVGLRAQTLGALCLYVLALGAITVETYFLDRPPLVLKGWWI
jgi:hypothetical protein